MSTTVLLLVSLFAALGGKIFSKLCSNAVVGNSNGRYAIFMAVNGTVACAFFFVWGGFRVSANLPTLMYAAVYAVIVVISLISNMLALKYINIATLTVVLSAFGLVTTSAVGALLFNETPDLTKITRIAVMLAAVILFAVDGKVNNKSKGGSKGFSVKAVIVVAILLAVGCAGSVVTKYFSLDSRVTDENSFFFLTNVILIVCSLPVIIFELIKDPEEIKKVRALFRPLNLLSLSGNTVCSNIGSIIGILLISQMEVSVYTPISSSIGTLSGFLGSLLLHEKLGAFSYLGVICALVAVII